MSEEVTGPCEATEGMTRTFSGTGFTPFPAYPGPPPPVEHAPRRPPRELKKDS